MRVQFFQNAIALRINSNAACHSNFARSAVAAILAVLASATSAALDIANTGVIDLPYAISRTLSDNPNLIAVGYQMQVQDAQILQAGIKPRPELIIEIENVLGSGPNDLLQGMQTTASIAWILERGVRARRVSAARAGSTLLETEITLQRLDAAAETARRYVQCLVLQNRLQNAAGGIQLGKEVVEATQRRVTAATTPTAELARARADLRRLELVAEDLQHELEAAFHRLAQQWGSTDPEFSRVIGDLLSIPNIESFETLRERLAQNPDIERYLSLQRMNDAQLKLEEAKNKQSWRVSGGFRWMEQTSDHAFVADITIPLGNDNSNRGRIAERRAIIARTEAEKKAQELRIETDLYVIYLELEHSIHLTRAFSNDMIPLYEQAMEETQLAYESGRYSYLEWSTSQLNLLNVRYELIDAAMSIYQNLIEIERLTGVTIEVPQLRQ
jgi:cobalt-zinc-cadmium efflux system outer membrane protein